MPVKTVHPRFSCTSCSKTLIYNSVELDPDDDIQCDYCFKYSKDKDFNHISLSCEICDIDCCLNCYRTAKQKMILKKIGNKPHKKSVLNKLFKKM
jgi:hypothetical protein